DHVARLDAVGAQSVRDPLDERGQLCVSVPALAVDEGELVGPLRRPAVEIGFETLVPPEAPLDRSAETLFVERGVHHLPSVETSIARASTKALRPSVASTVREQRPRALFAGGTTRERCAESMSGKSSVQTIEASVTIGRVRARAIIANALLVDPVMAR